MGIRKERKDARFHTFPYFVLCQATAKAIYSVVYAYSERNKRDKPAQKEAMRISVSESKLNTVTTRKTCVSFETRVFQVIEWLCYLYVTPPEVLSTVYSVPL